MKSKNKIKSTVNDLDIILITTGSINNCTRHIDTKYKVICDQNKSRHIATFYISTD